MAILALLCVLACLLLISGFCAWKINATFNQGVRLMSNQDDLLAIATKIDTATTQIGERVEAVVKKLAEVGSQVNTGLSEDDVTQLKAVLSGESDKLQVVADSLKDFAAAGDPANIPDPTSAPAAPGE